MQETCGENLKNSIKVHLRENTNGENRPYPWVRWLDIKRYQFFPDQPMISINFQSKLQKDFCELYRQILKRLWKNKSMTRLRKSLKKNKKVDSKTYYKAIIKTKSNWIKDVNVEEETIKLVGENTEKIYNLQVRIS